MQCRDSAECAAATLAAASVTEGVLECLGQANDAMGETSTLPNHEMREQLVDGRCLRFVDFFLKRVVVAIGNRPE